MYSTCIFCHRSLEANQTFESFPVGKRLAFDAAKGRLWVVCPHCERWNLSPLEERWEAIEQAERLYRDTRTRVATDNIGLAKLRDGTTIVRIGSPLRPEFAAWRYGDQFGRRRNRRLLIAGGGIAAVGAYAIGSIAVGAVAVTGHLAGAAMLASQAGFMIRRLFLYEPDQVVATVATPDRGIVHVRARDIEETSLARSERGNTSIALAFRGGTSRYEGAGAERIAAVLLPKINRFGASRRTVANAVRAIEEGGGPRTYVSDLAERAVALTEPAGRRDGWRGALTQEIGTPKRGLFGLSAEQRMAFEMALHEESERRAMDGELAELQRAWQDAEEIAAISDSLLIPPTVDRRVERLKSDSETAK